MSLSTVQGVTSAIEKLIANQVKGEAPPSKLMQAALVAVIEQIEKAASGKTEVLAALGKVRKACDLPQPKEKNDAPSSSV